MRIWRRGIAAALRRRFALLRFLLDALVLAEQLEARLLDRQHWTRHAAGRLSALGATLAALRLEHLQLAVVGPVGRVRIRLRPWWRPCVAAAIVAQAAPSAEPRLRRRRGLGRIWRIRLLLWRIRLLLLHLAPLAHPFSPA
jgi:hypothetical protein